MGKAIRDVAGLKEFVPEGLRLKESPANEAHLATCLAKARRCVKPSDPAPSAIRFTFEPIDEFGILARLERCW
jgi:hypothetical protein